MWKMLDKFYAEVIDSSSDDESDQTTQNMASVAASILHEYNASHTPVHRVSVKGCSENLSHKRGGRAPPAPQGLLTPHRSNVHEKIFRRRYKMSRDLFMVIYGASETKTHTSNAGPMQGALGFTTYQKCERARSLHECFVCLITTIEYISLCA
jgi:hypothetical protein